MRACLSVRFDFIMMMFDMGFFFCFLVMLVLFFAVCGLSLVVASGGNLLVAVYKLLIMVASLVTEHRLWGALDSVVVAPEL